ncbi:MAG: cold-shock protein [Candidatus Omnitrophota bacterium]
MTKGKVKWYSDKKNFGFITGEDGKDVFIHKTVLDAGGIASLQEGQDVEFEAQDSPKGPQATSIKLA